MIRTRNATQTKTIRCGAWRWVALADWATWLRRSAKTPWLDLAESRGASRIKQNEHRSVWRLELADRRVIAKVYRMASIRERLKALSLGSPAKREFQAALYAREKGLSVAEPIAYGRDTTEVAGSCVLLTAEVTGAALLSDYWRSGTDAWGRRNRSSDDALIQVLASMLRKMHAAGFVPADMHPNNILIRQVATGVHAVLVDPYKARIGSMPSRSTRVANLADLNQWFRRHASRTDRHRFLKAYLDADRAGGKGMLKHYVGAIDEITRKKAAKLQRKRDRRIFGDNKYFGVLRIAGHWRAHVFLRAQRPIAGSRCSELQFTKEDWKAALEPIIAQEHEMQTSSLRLGDHEIRATLESAEQSELQQRWQQEHKRINRHKATSLPLALLEPCSNGGVGQAILITEGSDDDEHNRRAH